MGSCRAVCERLGSGPAGGNGLVSPPLGYTLVPPTTALATVGAALCCQEGNTGVHSHLPPPGKRPALQVSIFLTFNRVLSDVFSPQIIFASCFRRSGCPSRAPEPGCCKQCPSPACPHWGAGPRGVHCPAFCPAGGFPHRKGPTQKVKQMCF